MLLICDHHLAMTAATMENQYNCTFQLITCITIDIWSFHIKDLELWEACRAPPSWLQGSSTRTSHLQCGQAGKGFRTAPNRWKCAYRHHMLPILSLLKQHLHKQPIRRALPSAHHNSSPRHLCTSMQSRSEFLSNMHQNLHSEKR